MLIVHSVYRPVFQLITSAQLPELECVHDNDGGERTHCVLPGNAFSYYIRSADEIRTISS